MPKRKETPMPSTPPVPDLSPSLPDPAAIDAATEEAHFAADRAEAQAFLARLAVGNPARVAAYRTVGADPRIRQWTMLLQKIDGRFPTEHIFLLEDVNRRLVGPRRWRDEADQAEKAEAQIPHLTGPECQLVSRETWLSRGIWNATIDRMAQRLQIVSQTEAQLRAILDTLEVDVRRVLGLYADARRAGMSPVTAREPIRSEPLRTELAFDPRKVP